MMSGTRRTPSRTMHEVREFAGQSDIRTTELDFVRKEEDAEVAARRVGGIQDVAYGLTSMVGCQGWNRDESIQVNGVDVSIMGHDRPRWRFRISTLMFLVILVA